MKLGHTAATDEPMTTSRKCVCGSQCDNPKITPSLLVLNDQAKLLYSLSPLACIYLAIIINRYEFHNKKT